MKQTLSFRVLFMLMAMQFVGSKTNAQEPYAALSEDNTVLTFYYDNNKESRNGMGVGPFSWNNFPSWYEQRKSIKTVVFDISFADCITITSTYQWFEDCKNLETITGISNLKTDNVTEMNRMFFGCESLTSLDLSNFNTANVSTMEHMFNGCSSLTSLDLSNFNTNKVNYMNSMFRYCSSLKTIYVDERIWTTKSVMYRQSQNMFSGCTTLVGGNGTTYDSNHTDYEYARIDKDGAPGYFTEKANTKIKEPYAVLNDDNTVLTFYYDNNKESQNGMSVKPFGVDKPGWYEQRENIKTVIFDDSFSDCITITYTTEWFYECKNLESIIGISNLKTDNVTYMDLMFYNCSSLTSLDLSNFNTKKVWNMRSMFSGCSSLKTIYADENKWSTSNVKDSYNEMFSDCSKLVGGNGTMYDPYHTGPEYARIDKEGQPGYFTQVGTTGIEQPKSQSVTEGGAWYTLDGRRMAGQPAVGGVYVKDGRKVVVK